LERQLTENPRLSIFEIAAISSRSSNKVDRLVLKTMTVDCGTRKNQAAKPR
jgi:hypothetical protein